MKTVKNRKRKFALGIKIAALCSCLALASVGFASWLVVQDPDATNTAGNVNVALTAEADLIFDKPTPTLGVGNGEYVPKFVFGRPADKGAVAIKWLVPQQVETEDMVEAYSVSYAPLNLPTNTIAHFTLNFDGVTTSVVDGQTNYTDVNTRLATLISKGYLTLTVTFGDQTVVYNDAKDGEENFTNALPAEGASVTYTVDWATLNAAALAAGGKGTIDFSIQFAWGSAFDGKNPYVYYNTLENPTAQQKEAALDVLAEIAALVKGLDKDAIKAGTALEPDPNPNALGYLIVIDAELDLKDVEY